MLGLFADPRAAISAARSPPVVHTLCLTLCETVRGVVSSPDHEKVVVAGALREAGVGRGGAHGGAAASGRAGGVLRIAGGQSFGETF